MPITAADRYDPTPDLNCFCQGDLVNGVPVVFMPPSGERWVVLRPGKSVTLEQAKRGAIPSVFKPSVEHENPDAWEGSEELVVAKATKTLIALLTQTCDIDHRKHLQVAPVYSAEGLDERKLSSLHVDEIKHWFYLPDDPPHIRESYVDIAKVVSIHRSYLSQAHFVKRHSNSGLVALQVKLAQYFGRPFGFNMRDTVPTTAEYMCLKCIYDFAEIRRVRFDASVTFGRCPRCGDQALWAICPARR
jgi:hypothetical protein